MYPDPYQTPASGTPDTSGHEGDSAAPNAAAPAGGPASPYAAAPAGGPASPYAAAPAGGSSSPYAAASAGGPVSPYAAAPGRPRFFPSDPYRAELARACGTEQKLLRRRCSWAGWATLASLILLQIFYTMCYLVLPAAENSAGYYFEVTFAYTTGFSLAAILLARALHMPLNAALPMQKTGVLTAAAAVLFGSAACNLANYPANIVATLLESAGLSGSVPSYQVDSSPLACVMLVVSSCVVPALVEEFLFRGVILRSLMRFGTGFAIVASSLLFALMHGNISQIVFAFPLGLLFAYLIVRTGNLWITIAIHFINNLLSSLYLILAAVYGTAAADLYSIVFPIVLWVLGGLSLVVLLVRTRGSFFRLSPPRTLLDNSAKLSAFVLNPGVLLFLAYTIFSCVVYLIPA